jgi:hypothetical protein
MIKKIFVWSLIAGGVLFAVNSVRPGVISTAMKRVHAKFERSINPEFELARIRDQIAQLTPDMYKNFHRVAQEMVEVERLKGKADDLQARLDVAKSELAVLTEAVEKGTTRVSINGRDFKVTDLRGKLRTCQNLEGELNRTKQIYEAKKTGVEAARQQLAEVKKQKEELEVLAAQYEADLKMLALEQTKVKVQLDDSRLAEIKQSMENLRERIDVERRTAELADQFKNDTITEKKPVATKDVVEEARDYLGSDRKIDATKK